MDEYSVRGQLPEKKEMISLNVAGGKKHRGFAMFLICCGLLLAAFAVSTLWAKNGGEGFFGNGGGILDGETDTTAQNNRIPNEPETSDPTSQSPPHPPLPSGATPIVSMDLAYLDRGKNYIYNETVYTPDVEGLLNREVLVVDSSKSPKVLILHTHTSEGYLAPDAEYIEGSLGDSTYTRDSSNSVVAVGEVLARVLNEKGITAIHCTVMHDDPTVKGAYDRAKETIQYYLSIYPDIQYVIDLHRDAVLSADGEYVRTTALSNGESVAQVMAVVGTDGNGTDCAHWEDNLALALQLRNLLNANGASVCRPVSLKNASYNQELATRSLLLEIGTGANSIEEAKRSAELVGEALAVLLQER